MRLFLVMIDDLYLKFFTVFSHWFQRLTGRTNFFLAKIAAAVVLAQVAVSIGNYFSPVLSVKTDLFGLVMSGIATLILLMYFVGCDEAEARAFRGNNSKYLISPLVHERWFRLLSLIFVLFTSPFIPHFIFKALTQNSKTWYFEMIDLLGAPAFTAFLYLVNVDPMLPQKSKV